jgi:hypothetical protein
MIYIKISQILISIIIIMNTVHHFGFCKSISEIGFVSIVGCNGKNILLLERASLYHWTVASRWWTMSKISHVYCYMPS